MLSYDDMDGYAGEFFWYARNETNTFAKGFIGGSGLNGDSLDDEDYFAGQVKFSDSQLKGESLLYGTIDVGQHSWPRYALASSATTTGRRRQPPMASAAMRTMSSSAARSRPGVGSPDGNGRGRHPAGDLCGDEDSNLLRGDLGRPPNVEDRGIGWGYQLEAALRYDFTPGWSAGAGVRYWYAEVDGKASSSISTPRWVYGDVSYRF